MLATGSIVVIGINASRGQEQETGPVETVQPEIQGEAPPLMLEDANDRPARRVADGNAEQLLTSLLRAQEALQLDNRAAAMQALMQAEEQLDQAAEESPNTGRWQQIDRAIQAAMKALGSDSVAHALVALESATLPLQKPNEDEQDPRSILDTMPASDIVGAQVVNARGEAIAEIRDIVRARTGGADLYAILEIDGGLLDLENKNIPVALDQFEATADHRIVLPDATESQLEEMPTYDQEKYEQLR